LPLRQWGMEVLGPGRVGVLPAQGTDAGGAALRAGPKGKPHQEPGTRQPVDVGSTNSPIPIAADVAPAEVIGNEHDDVWAGTRVGLGRETRSPAHQNQEGQQNAAEHDARSTKVEGPPQRWPVPLPASMGGDQSSSTGVHVESGL